MDDREQRGLALAALYLIQQQDGKRVVPPQADDGCAAIIFECAHDISIGVNI